MSGVKKALGLAFVGMIALHSQANAGSLSDFSASRFWKLEASSDPFNGESKRVMGLGMDDANLPTGLIVIRSDNGAAMFSITNTDDFICPDEKHGRDVEVEVWFSDGGPTLSQIWRVSAGHDTVMSYDGGPEILGRLFKSDKVIFRIHDGCGDIKDYWTKATNVQDEWLDLIGY